MHSLSSRPKNRHFLFFELGHLGFLLYTSIPRMNNLIGDDKGAVENLRPSVAIAPNLSSQVASGRRTKREALRLPHSFQKAGLILKEKEVSPATAHRFLASIHHLENIRKEY